MGDETRFLTEFQQRFIQNWHFTLESSGRYEVYRTFKSALEKEKYLEVIQNQQIRKAFTRFRLGISQILTHKRRYTDENVVMLRCPLCKVKPKMKCICLRPVRGTIIFAKSISLDVLIQRFSGTTACMLLPRNTVPVYLPCPSTFSMPYV